EPALDLEERAALSEDVCVVRGEEALAQAEDVYGLEHIRLPRSVRPDDQVDAGGEGDLGLGVGAEREQAERAEAHEAGRASGSPVNVEAPVALQRGRGSEKVDGRRAYVQAMPEVVPPPPGPSSGGGLSPPPFFFLSSSSSRRGAVAER